MEYEKKKMESGSSERGEATTGSVEKSSLEELLSSLTIFLVGGRGMNGWKGGSNLTSEKRRRENT
jgi:hypothetical protein